MLCVPVQLVDMRQSFACQADAYFGTKFHGLALLSPDNGPKIRLTDTDDAIFTAAAVSFVHFMLLVIQMRQYPVAAQQPMG